MPTLAQQLQLIDEILRVNSRYGKVQHPEVTLHYPNAIDVESSDLPSPAIEAKALDWCMGNG